MTKDEQRVATDVPSLDAITPYDEAHFEMYVRILDASEAGAGLGEIAETILGIDPRIDPERAIKAARSHLWRALDDDTWVQALAADMRMGGALR